MLIPLKEVIQKYNLNIKGVIQVGAHWAEEHEIYKQLGIENIVYIEPCKESFDVMYNKIFGAQGHWLEMNHHNDYIIGQTKDNIIFFRCACGEKEGELDMFVSDNNQGQSNSLLKPKLHLNQHPEVQFTKTEKVIVMPLDKLYFEKEKYNLLMMDVQGAEGLVLKGATETLKHIDCIYTEVNRDYTYEGNMLIGEMDSFLKDYGFERVETYFPSANWSWGDAVFIKSVYV